MLPQAGFAPAALCERAAFRMSKRGGGIPGAAYLLRLSLSPNAEDWPKVRKMTAGGSGIAEAQMRAGPQNDHGPAPEEDCVFSLQISSVTLGADIFLRRWKFHAQVQRALIAEHAQRQ